LNFYIFLLRNVNLHRDFADADARAAQKKLEEEAAAAAEAAEAENEVENCPEGENEE